MNVFSVFSPLRPFHAPGGETPTASPCANWILFDGTWSDIGTWSDTCTWSDA